MEAATGQLAEELRLGTAGYETHAWRAGAGRDDAVLLLHGGGPGAVAWSNWAPTLRRLGAAYDVIAPDLLGFGNTDHPDPLLYGPQAWLQARVVQLEALLDALGHERADLVGNSLGGALALNFALEHPDRVRRLVLMGSGGAPFEPGPELIHMLSFYRDPSAENLRAILGNFVFDLDRFEGAEELVEQRLAAAADPRVQRSFEAMFRTEDGRPIGEIAVEEQRVRELRVPALIVHGRDDRIVPLSCGLWLLERLPDAELHVFGSCGHWAMLEHRDGFCRIVDEFLKRRTELPA